MRIKSVLLPPLGLGMLRNSEVLLFLQFHVCAAILGGFCFGLHCNNHGTTQIFIKPWALMPMVLAQKPLVLFPHVLVLAGVELPFLTMAVFCICAGDNIDNTGMF